MGTDVYTLALFFGGLGLAIISIAFFLLLRLARARGAVSRSLNLQLIAVRFLQYPTQELTLQQIREKIGLMEQFYSHLYALKESWWRRFWHGKPSFALELTIPHAGEELAFYLAVPRRFIPAIEKVTQGIFSDAHVEVTQDYNIFNPSGESTGACITLKQNLFYPIKTYQKLEGDPMKALTNVFTKLEKIGEGAALQIIATPASKKWQRILKDRARALHQGKGNAADNRIAPVIQTIDKIIGFPDFANTQQSPSIAQQNMQKKITPLEEETVRALEAKAGKILFETNVRVLASAKTKQRADEILQGLIVALGQFDDPNLNRLNPVVAQGAAFKKLVFRFSFRTFDESHKMILGTDELTSLFHFPNVAVETPKLRQLKTREAAAPANLPREGLLLGYNIFREQKTDIRILDEDRRRHLYIIGQTGTGKTAFLKNQIVQDIEAGRGVCFIDPHGDTAEELLGLIPRQRLQDVIYFNPGDVARPMGLNMLEYDPAFPEQKTFIVNELLSIFEKLYGAVPEALGPMFQQYFRNATMLVMDDPQSGNTLLEIGRVMAEKRFRDLKLSRAKNIVVRNFWTEIAEKAGSDAELRNMVPYITSKIDTFTANDIMRPIIAQEHSAFSFREVMDNQRILLVNLSKGRLGDLNSSLIGLIVVGKLTMAALSRADISDQEKRKDFYLYIDEFQNVTTDSIATIFSEARKYRLNLTVAHQFIKQMHENIKNSVFGNVGSMVAFRIGSEDGEFLEKQFAPVFKTQDLINLDNYHCYVKLLIAGATAPPFSMNTYPPRKGDADTGEIVKEISRVKYGRPREKIEQQIIARHEQPLPSV